MFEKLDRNAEEVINAAQHYAKRYNQASVDADHLLMALVETNPIRELLTHLEIIPAEVSTSLDAALQDKGKVSRDPNLVLPILTFSLRLRRIMELAWLEVSALNQETIGEVHMLLALVREGKSPGLSFLLERRAENSSPAFLKTLYATFGLLSDEKGDADLARSYYRRLYLLDAFDPRIPKAYLPLLKETGKTQKAALSRFDQYNIIDESEVIDEPTVTFNDVAGIEDPDSEYYRVKRIFELVFLYPEQYRELAGEFGIANTGTLLLFGPTGVGKTFICKAMAGEYLQRTGRKLTLINARLSSVMDKWVGNTEKNITKLIEIALERSPSLLVLDEIDSLGSERGAGTRDYKVDWVNHLLIELDRLKNSRKANLVVACTNAIDRVDLALRRRLGTPIVIPLPDQATRAQIFRLYIQKVAASVRADIDYKKLGEATVGFTPSDIEEVVQETINRVWLEIVDVLAKNSLKPSSKRLLCTEDFSITLSKKTPSVSISRWVKDSVDQLRINDDEALAQRLTQAFKGYYAIDDFFHKVRSQPTQRWFTQKP